MKLTLVGSAQSSPLRLDSPPFPFSGAGSLCSKTSLKAQFLCSQLKTLGCKSLEIPSSQSLKTIFVPKPGRFGCQGGPSSHGAGAEPEGFALGRKERKHIIYWSIECSATFFAVTFIHHPQQPEDRIPSWAERNLRVGEILAPRLITEWDQIGTLLSLLGCSEGPAILSQIS